MNRTLSDRTRRCDAPVSTSIPSPPQWPAVTLSSDLQNLRSWDIVVTRYVQINGRINRQTNGWTYAEYGQPENIMPMPTLSSGDGTINNKGNIRGQQWWNWIHSCTWWL